jgi:hypothetical protein
MRKSAVHGRIKSLGYLGKSYRLFSFFWILTGLTLS